MKKEESVAFFNLINTLYERTSVIITTNKSPTEWVGVLQDEVLATALLDNSYTDAMSWNSQEAATGWRTAPAFWKKMVQTNSPKKRKENYELLRRGLEMIHKAVDEYGKACDDPNKNAQEYYDGIVG